MNTFPKILVALVSLGWALTAGAATAPTNAPATQAIRQATDPSSVIAAYANASAPERNDPNLYGAFVSRMVDLGLPELAYRQAQTLTVLQPDNGLGWAVVAYVDARRGDMASAVPALQKAGQSAPDNPLVARTAGGIAAWYDSNANKATLPEDVKNGVAKLREQFKSNATFTDAYKSASEAYLAQAGSSQQAAQTATNAPYQAAPVPTQPAQPQAEAYPSLGYAAPTYAPTYSTPYYSDYYPNYYPPYYYSYNYWGPGWIGPEPWWASPGYFYGSAFIPFGPVIVFGNGFHHDHHDGEHHGDHHNDFNQKHPNDPGMVAGQSRFHQQPNGTQPQHRNGQAVSPNSGTMTRSTTRPTVAARSGIPTTTAPRDPAVAARSGTTTRQASPTRVAPAPSSRSSSALAGGAAVNSRAVNPTAPAFSRATPNSSSLATRIAPTRSPTLPSTVPRAATPTSPALRSWTVPTLPSTPRVAPSMSPRPGSGALVGRAWSSPSFSRPMPSGGSFAPRMAPAPSMGGGSFHGSMGGMAHGSGFGGGAVHGGGGGGGGGGHGGGGGGHR